MTSKLYSRLARLTSTLKLAYDQAHRLLKDVESHETLTRIVENIPAKPKRKRKAKKA